MRYIFILVAVICFAPFSAKAGAYGNAMDYCNDRFEGHEFIEQRRACREEQLDAKEEVEQIEHEYRDSETRSLIGDCDDYNFSNYIPLLSCYESATRGVGMPSYMNNPYLR